MPLPDDDRALLEKGVLEMGGATTLPYGDGRRPWRLRVLRRDSARPKLTVVERRHRHHRHPHRGTILMIRARPRPHPAGAARRARARELPRSPHPHRTRGLAAPQPADRAGGCRPSVDVVASAHGGFQPSWAPASPGTLPRPRHAGKADDRADRSRGEEHGRGLPFGVSLPLSPFFGIMGVAPPPDLRPDHLRRAPRHTRNIEQQDEPHCGAAPTFLPSGSFRARCRCSPASDGHWRCRATARCSASPRRDRAHALFSKHPCSARIALAGPRARDAGAADFTMAFDPDLEPRRS